MNEEERKLKKIVLRRERLQKEECIICLENLIVDD